ncbi:MAG: hypothetical protein ACLQG5_05880 [Methanobacterium sp.]
MGKWGKKILIFILNHIGVYYLFNTSEELDIKVETIWDINNRIWKVKD